MSERAWLPFYSQKQGDNQNLPNTPLVFSKPYITRVRSIKIRRQIWLTQMIEKALDL